MQLKTEQGLRLPLCRVSPYAIYVGMLLLAFPVTPDDAFITLRYAGNLLGGAGALFNLGQRVEGYSSPLHLLISAALLGICGARHVILAAKIVGALLGAWILFKTKHVALRVGLSEREAVFAQVLLALNGHFAVAAVNGLETPFYGAILLLLVTVTLRERDRRRGVASAFIAFAGAITRPEAVLLFPIFFLLRAHFFYEKGKVRLLLRDLSVWSACFLVPFSAFLLLRWSYYGALLPNTYFAKQYSWQLAASDGFRYLMRPLSPRTASLVLSSRLIRYATPWFFWPPVIAGIWLARKNARCLVLGAVLLMQLIFCIKAGGDWMQGWRFMIVVGPSLAIFQCFGLRGLARMVARRLARGPAPSPARALTAAQLSLLGFWVVAFALSPKGPSWPQLGFTTDPGVLLSATGSVEGGWGAKQVVAAKLVQEMMPSGSTFAFTEIGFTGFLNMDKRIVDMRGLTDREIARIKSYKSPVGVSDPEWFKPTSPVGSIMMRRQIDAILTLEEVPVVVLDSFEKVTAVEGVQLYARRGHQLSPR